MKHFLLRYWLKMNEKVKQDQKLKINKTVSTVDGTLYENEIVKFQRKEDGHYRVKDSMGRIWFVDKKYLKDI